MTTAVPESHDPPHTPSPSTGSTEPTKPPRSHLSRRLVLQQIGGLAIAGGIIGGAGLIWAHTPGAPLSYEAKQLRALKNDPMGATKILGYRAIHAEESPLPKWFESKYSGVHLYRWFSDKSMEPEQLRLKFIDYATLHGWSEKTSYKNSWTGKHNQSPDDYMTVFISINEDSGYSYLNNAVRIVLTYI
ncbi:hypothetical protein [Actinomyces oris]|uniref:hypothetical protein n=1 Tax=Actinomyces oris TaxID=544580 RepID=UPI001181965D|nr:hypothetical protein [Actinomyces oris]